MEKKSLLENSCEGGVGGKWRQNSDLGNTGPRGPWEALHWEAGMWGLKKRGGPRSLVSIL